MGDDQKDLTQLLAEWQIFKTRLMTGTKLFCAVLLAHLATLAIVLVALEFTGSVHQTNQAYDRVMADHD